MVWYGTYLSLSLLSITTVVFLSIFICVVREGTWYLVACIVAVVARGE
jgi:hypothetical protein